jgi:exosortase
MRFSDAARLSPPELPLLALAASVWPMWQWLAMRALHDPGDAWPLLSLATAMAVLWRDRAERSPEEAEWTLPALFLLLYAAAYLFVPPLVRSLIAMSAIAAACSSVWWGRRIDLPLWGLLLLSLPWVPSLNFFIGYPLRVFVGDAASTLLQMNGFTVLREGAALHWNGREVLIDAPCSGVKMLWTGLYLSCALAALQRLNVQRTLLLGCIAFGLVMVANVLRAAALFYVEAGIVPQAKPAHALIGFSIFLIAAVSILSAAMRLRGVAHAS